MEIAKRLALGMALAIPACTGTIGDLGSASEGPGGENRSASSAGPPTRISGSRRLSRSELKRTLQRLFGSDVDVDVGTLPADTLTPFDNDIIEQSPSMLLVESLEGIARDAANWVTATPERMSRVVPCKPAAPDDAACFGQFVDAFGLRALRRPVAAEEKSEYLELLSYGKSSGDFAEAVRMAIRVFLLQPELVYRVEIGTEHDGKRIKLSPYELASRLSYLLQGASPDDALLGKAASGDLDTPDGLNAALDALLATPEAKEQTRRFHALWLGYSTLEKSPLHDALRSETDALIDRATDGRDYRYLLLASETYIDGTLASHYGLTAATAPGWVSYGDAPRIGILSHGAFAAAGMKFGDTSPTRRGKFIRERFLCQPIPLPPPDINVDVDQPPKGAATCKKDRYAAHRENKVCASCHGRMDPIGFGLEIFDKDGKLRTHDEGHPECPLDGAGQLDGGQTFTGAKGLAPLIANDPQFVSCFGEHFLRFASGRKLDDTDAARVQWMSTVMSEKSNSFTALVRAYVTHENFRYREEQ